LLQDYNLPTQTTNHDLNYTYGHILPTIRFLKIRPTAVFNFNILIIYSFR